MSDLTYIVLAGTGVALFVGGGIYLKKSMSPPSLPGPSTDTSGQNRELLAHVSDRWTDKQIQLAELCVLWKEKEEDRRGQLPLPTFNNEDIDLFWVEVVEPLKYLPLNRRTAIEALLRIIDESGDCPSVVRNPKYKAEAENDYADDFFNYLSKISLREHTLLVARHIAKRSSRDILIPDGIIIGLAHDLGKIPVYHDTGYSTGDHPIISSIVMAGLPELAALPNCAELCNMVKSHHYTKPHNAFADLLKDCDQIARNEESARRFQPGVQPQREFTSKSVTAGTPKASLPASDKKAPQNDHPMGFAPPSGYKPLERVDTPWLDTQALLDEIKSKINVVLGGRWAACSMPDGLVYVNPEFVWASLKKTAGDEGSAALSALEANAQAKQNILFSVVQELDEKHRAIATDAISPNHYTVRTVLTEQNATRKGVLMVPFRAEAFGMLPSQLESTKTPVIKMMVKSIRIMTHEDDAP